VVLSLIDELLKWLHGKFIMGAVGVSLGVAFSMLRGTGTVELKIKITSLD
jgi:hypothetical protein